MNSCHFVGRLSKEAETKKTDSGIIYCQFDIAVRRNKTDAYFIHCIAYDKLGGLVGKIAHKGDKVALSGYLRPSIVTTKEGIRVERYVIVADNVEFLERAKHITHDGEVIDDD